jgi:hypothetical protein
MDFNEKDIQMSTTNESKKTAPDASYSLWQKLREFYPVTPPHLGNLNVRLYCGCLEERPARISHNES